MLKFNKSLCTYLTALFLGLALNSVATAQETKSSTAGAVDAQLPSYKAVSGVSGAMKSIGSDTLNNLMTDWGEAFKQHYKNTECEIEGKGSGTAMPALSSGQSTFGPMSRACKKDEITAFKTKFGYEPTALPVALDMLAVFVNKDNPIKGLTLPQVDAIFSTTRKLGYREDLAKWGQLGLAEAAQTPISLYGRDNASGTYGFFKEQVLGNGDFKDAVKVQPGSSGVVQAIGTEKYAIGYSGMGYTTPNVRSVPLAKAEGEEFVPAESQYAYNMKYPLTRALFVTVNKNPVQPLDPLRREFIRFIFSKEGQALVVKNGYLPLSAKACKKALAMVDVTE